MLGHPALHGNRTGDRLYDAWELDQDAVAGGLDDAALVIGDFGSMRSRRSALRRASVPASSTHQPAIADDIRCQNGREASLNPPFAHRCASPKRALQLRVWPNRRSREGRYAQVRLGAHPSALNSRPKSRSNLPFEIGLHVSPEIRF